MDNQGHSPPIPQWDDPDWFADFFDRVRTSVTYISIIKQAWRPRSQQLTNSLLEFWRFTVVSVLHQWRTCCTLSESFRNWTKQDLPFTIWSDPMPLGLVWLHYGILRFRIQTVCNAHEQHTYLIIFEYLIHLCPQLMYMLNYVYTYIYVYTDPSTQKIR